MTKLFDEAVDAARNLAPAQQDEIARMMLAYADLPLVELTEEEDTALARSEAAAVRGEFATDDEVRAIWTKRRA